MARLAARDKEAEASAEERPPWTCLREAQRMRRTNWRLEKMAMVAFTPMSNDMIS